MENTTNVDAIITTALQNYGHTLEKEMHSAVKRLKIGQSNELDNSIKTNVRGKQLVVYFKGYGRFVDMGVGKGFPIGGNGTTNFEKYRNKKGQLVKSPTRKAKSFYSKPAYGLVNSLKREISVGVSELAKQQIKEQLQSVSTLKIHG